MLHRPLHYLASAAVTLTALALVSACGPAPVSPLPGQSGGPPSPTTATASASPTPARTTPVAQPPPPQNPKPTTPSPTPSSTCQGRITYELDLSGQPTMSPCLTVGAIVRVEDIGPGLLVWTPVANASCNYEAGVDVCRLLEPGTIRFTNNQPSEPVTVSVVVIP